MRCFYRAERQAKANTEGTVDTMNAISGNRFGYQAPQFGMNIKPQDIIKAVSKVADHVGYNGSHNIYKLHQTGQRLAIPVHSGKGISDGVFNTIAVDMNLSKKELMNFIANPKQQKEYVLQQLQKKPIQVSQVHRFNRFA